MGDHSATLLDTLYKAKLPRGWSYPIGAEGLTASLGGVEGAAAQPLRFSDRVIRSSVQKQLAAEDKPYRILEVRYCRPTSEADRTLAAERGRGDQWEVYIDPVHSHKRAVVRAGLVEAALPVVRRWLEKTCYLEAQQGRGSCRVLYDAGLRQFYVEQAINSFEKPTRVELPLPAAPSVAG